MPFRAIHGAKREFMAKPIHDALASIHFIRKVPSFRPSATRGEIP